MASSGVLPCFPAGLLPGWGQNAGLPGAVKQASVPARLVSPIVPLESSKKESPSSPLPSLSESPQTRSECSSPLRKKRTRRKRCGTCKGCLKKDNCGSCSVCSNANSTNSICKHRRCDALIKKRSSLSMPFPVQRNLFSFHSLERPSSTILSPVSPYHIPGVRGLPTSHDSHIMPVKDVPRTVRRRRQTNPYHPFKTPLKDPPPCGCPGNDEGFYYTHLGAAKSPEAVRTMLEERFSVTGSQLRVMEVVFTGIEAKTSEGCPTAEWVIRRESKEELFLALYRHNKGHICGNIYTVVSIVLWEGIAKARAELIYNHLTSTLPKYGQPTPRRCAVNETKTCVCQGNETSNTGASYSFGCSWSVYYNGCKFAKSKVPRKFRLSDESLEGALEDLLQSLATDLAPVYNWLAPDSYKNQLATQMAGQECRLGSGEERPFSGITCCMDFCAHSHYDRQNMTTGGATVVCTILKKGVLGDECIDDSEQLHVLPLYRLKDPPRESIPGIEVRPVETEIRPSPVPSRASTPQQLGWPNFPPSSSSTASTPLTFPQGVYVKSEIEDSPRTPGSKAPSIGPPQFNPDWQLTPQKNSGTEDGKMTPPIATLSRDLSSSMSSLNETPPRPSFLVSEDSLSSPPSVPTQTGSVQKPYPPSSPNDCQANGLSGGNGFPRVAIHSLLAQCAKLEGGKLVRNGHLVNGLSPHLFHDISSQSTDSDSEPGARLDSPQHPSPQPWLSVSTPTSRPSTPLPDGSAAGHQVKRESPLVEPAAGSQPLCSRLPSLTPLNGAHPHPHQLAKSQSFTLEKPLELVAGGRPTGPPPPSTPPPHSSFTAHTPLSHFRSPGVQNRVFGGPKEEEEDEEEMEIKPNERTHAIPGGVAMALDHGSILIEVAKKELHATTPIKNPCRSMPTRISMVFYQHKTMTRRFHGRYEEEEKQRCRREEARRKAAREEEEGRMREERMMQLQPPPLPAPQLHPTFFNFSNTVPMPLVPCQEERRTDTWSKIDDDDLDDIFDPFMFEDNSLPVAIGRVPRPIPLHQLENPFYLELPLKEVDTQKQVPVLRMTCYPPPHITTTTLTTHTVHYSLCKPSDVLSGNWTREPPPPEHAS